MSNILVISPHPDDESIGCGGTIRKHILDGDAVEVIFLTSGEKGGHGRPEDETIRVREEEARAAAEILGISKIDFWRQPDGALKISEDMVSLLREKIETSDIALIYVPHEEENHPDHQAAARLVSMAVGTMKGGMVKPIVWMYEVWTPLQNIGHIVDISPFIEDKRRAIQAHKSQCDILKFDEAILALNRYRGEMHSWPGGDFAEIFKRMKK